MQQVQQELLAALAQALESLSEGSGDKARFETPKVASHGDWAVTAASSATGRAGSGSAGAGSGSGASARAEAASISSGS